MSEREEEDYESQRHWEVDAEDEEGDPISQQLVEYDEDVAAAGGTPADEEESEEEESEEEESEEEEDEVDDEDVEPPPEEEDPEYTGVDPRGHPAEYYQAGADDNGEFHDEPEESTKERWYENRMPLIFCILCCCCLVLVAIALVLVFLVFGKDDDSSSPSGSNNPGPNPVPVPTNPATFPTMSPQGGGPPVEFSYPTAAPQASPPSAKAIPTRFPTISPAPTPAPVVKNTPAPTRYPTIQPTKSPAPTQLVPDELVILPIEDTYIVDGFYEFERHGSEETFLVQNADNNVNEIPDSFALLKFDLSGIPFGRIQNRENAATLELTHELAVVERGPATYTVERLNSTNLAVETLHRGLFPLPEDGLRGPTFEVAPSDESVTIDVSELFFGGEYEPADDPQALIMIVNYGPEQEAGDRFRSREAQGLEPKLTLTFTRIPGVPDSTPVPATPAPTQQLATTEAPSPATNSTA